MKIAYRVQHLAGRDAPLERLLKRLPRAVVVTDDERESKGPNPLRGYLKCLQLESPPGATHLCIIQDDALPCLRFKERLEEAVAGRPADLISLFVGGLPNRTRRDFLVNLQDNQPWSPVYFRDIHHVVALVWPIVKVDEFLDWLTTTKLPGGTIPRSDDAAVGYWARKTRQQFWATVPCLVEHPDDVPSTVRSSVRQGDRGRRAIHFLE